MLVILFLYLATIFCISFFVGKRNKEENNQDYFTAKKSSNWLAVSFGMVGATISGISVVSVPGQVISSSFLYMNTVLGFIVGYYVVAYVLLPIYYKKGYTSIYQLIGDRIGPHTHKATSLLFLIYKLLGSAVKLYVVVMVLDKLLFPTLGINYYVGTALIILMIYLYTFRSGVSTVVITDCVQTSCLFICAIVLLYKAYNYAGENTDVPLSAVYDNYLYFLNNYLQAGSLTCLLNTVIQFLSGIFLVIVMTGLDQDVMQKNLTCRDLKSAQKNMILSGYMFVPINFILLLTGALLVVGANSHGVDVMSLSDALVIGYAKMFGIVSILCLEIGMLSASLSSADSALVGLTTSYFFDLKGVKIEDISKTKRYFVQGIFALLLFVFVCLFKYYSGNSALDLIYQLTSYILGPLLGLFIFSIFTKRKVRDNMAVLAVFLSFLLVIPLSNLLVHSEMNYAYSLVLLTIALFLVFLLTHPKIQQ